MATTTDTITLRDKLLPVAVMLLLVTLVWYLGAWAMNSAGAIERVLTPSGNAWDLSLIHISPAGFVPACAAKPPNLLVHRSEIDRHETRFAIQILRNQIGQRVWPAHRLDRGTSGILLFGLNPEIASSLGRQFETGTVKKLSLIHI